jgi:ADP-dependent phosphofructokinase/glucokinase
MKTRFNKGKNLVLPLYDKKDNLIFIHPKKSKGLDKDLFLHLISEVKKNDTLKIDDRMNWRCPRDNRFISTYDPPNIEMHLMKSFRKNIELIAQQVDGFLLSGFHMMDSDELGKEGVSNRIIEILSIIKRAKEANPELIVHLEAASTKSELILEELYKLSMKGNYWDSLGCNERELVEILRAMGEKRFGNELRKSFTQSKVVEGCLKIIEKLGLQRFHLHQYGCYLLIARKEYFDDLTQLKYSQCFSSLVTAEKALIGEASNRLDYKLLLSEINPDENISKSFKQLTRAIAKLTNLNSNELIKTGTSEINDYYIIATPSIMIDNPIFTVGLGDTISASALAAELAYKKKKSEK